MRRMNAICLTHTVTIVCSATTRCNRNITFINGSSFDDALRDNAQGGICRGGGDAGDFPPTGFSFSPTYLKFSIKFLEKPLLPPHWLAFPPTGLHHKYHPDNARR